MVFAMLRQVTNDQCGLLQACATDLEERNYGGLLRVSSSTLPIEVLLTGIV